MNRIKYFDAPNVLCCSVYKGGFPFSGKYRAIDFFRLLSFELQ